MKTPRSALARRLRTLKLRAAIVGLVATLMVLLAPSPPILGTTLRIEDDPDSPLSSSLPPTVVEEATSLARELFPNYPEGYAGFLDQLLWTYSEARGKDFVLLFNPGGWGWKFLDPLEPWYGISRGIEGELDSLGYKSVLLDYQRTENSLRGYLAEFTEMLNDYPSRSRELAALVNFLTGNLPEVNIILAGESTGTVISDRTMNLLGNNPQVYSIVTGPPFWHQISQRDRVLVMRDNGLVPDTFSRGDVFAMFSATIENLLGQRSSQKPGNVLLYLGAPGHDYRWQYPGVYSKIEEFIHKQFDIK